MISDIEALKRNEILNSVMEPFNDILNMDHDIIKLKDCNMVKVSFHGKTKTRYIVDVSGDGKFYVSEV